MTRTLVLVLLEARSYAYLVRGTSAAAVGSCGNNGAQEVFLLSSVST
jgi:hypothetical protein